MRWLAVWRAMSQALRLLRWDFGRRRKRRLFNVAAVRMGMLELKEKVMAIAIQHERQEHNPLNIDDFFYGPYQYLLVDFGPAEVEAAIKELAREGVVRRERRGGIDVLQPTRRHYYHVSATPLRQVLDQMKLHLAIRYTDEYHSERTFEV